MPTTVTVECHGKYSSSWAGYLLDGLDMGVSKQEGDEAWQQLLHWLLGSYLGCAACTARLTVRPPPSHHSTLVRSMCVAAPGA